LINRKTVKFFYAAGLKRIGEDKLLAVILEGNDTKDVTLKVLLFTRKEIDWS